MSRDLSKLAAWRDLDVSQIHLWPDMPRRLMIALATLLFFVLMFVNVLWPRMTQLDEVQTNIEQRQKHIINTYKISPLLLTNIPPVRQIKRSEESAWLANLANLARGHHLRNVMVSAHDLNESERGQFRTHIQSTVKNSNSFINKQNVDLPLDWLGQVAWIGVSVSGNYADVLRFVSDLGRHDEWLAMGNVEIKAVDTASVRWTAGFWYYKEAAPTATATDAASGASTITGGRNAP